MVMNVKTVPMVDAIVSIIEMQSDYLLLRDVRWHDYEHILRLLDDRHLRITYDQGALEVMTLSAEHEYLKHLLRRIIEALIEELGLKMIGLASVTLRRSNMEKGLEPDECYWIQNAIAVKNPRRYTIQSDPPPDVALEIDITHPSLDRLPIYAAFQVPEIWRHDGNMLHIHVLVDDKYSDSEYSYAFPFVTAAELTVFIQKREQIDEVEWIQHFRAWVRERIAAGWQ
jgi:Uma2 family endonuclease